MDVSGGGEAGDVEAVPGGDIGDDASADEGGHGLALGLEVARDDVGEGPRVGAGGA